MTWACWNNNTPPLLLNYSISLSYRFALLSIWIGVLPPACADSADIISTSSLTWPNPTRPLSNQPQLITQSPQNRLLPVNEWPSKMMDRLCEEEHVYTLNVQTQAYSGVFVLLLCALMSSSHSLWKHPCCYKKATPASIQERREQCSASVGLQALSVHALYSREVDFFF